LDTAGYIFESKFLTEKKYNHGITRSITEKIKEWIRFLEKIIRQD